VSGFFFCAKVREMPLFDADNRLTADACAVGLKDRGNRSIADYTLLNMRAPCPPEDLSTLSPQHPIAVAARHRNLQPWDGYGFNVCTVDSDSALRVDSEVTHPRMRIQLPKRVFQASPNLSHGQASPDIESKMQGGMDSSQLRRCDVLAEKDWARFDPGVCAVGAQHIIPPWTNGGAPSREIARSGEFLSTLGYVHDGRVWRRS
jgi:hypothetical protein